MASTSQARTAVPVAAAPLGSGPQGLQNYYIGTVNQFRVDKGFGFIDLPVGDYAGGRLPSGRIFFHVKNLWPKVTNSVVVALFLHKKVRFTLGHNPRNGRLCAQNIHLENYAGPLPVTPVSFPTGTLSSDLLSAMAAGHGHAAQAVAEPEFDWQPLNLNFDDAINPIDVRAFIDHGDELLNWQSNTKQLRKQAIEMGFTIPLVEQALGKTDAFDMPKQYPDFGAFLTELMEIQDAELAHSGFFGAFEENSDDFRFNAWMAQANEMGFSHDIVLEAMFNNGANFDNFQDLIERVMLLLADREAPRGAVVKVVQQPPVVAPPPVPVVNVASLTKENADLRDYFACKICMSGDAVIVFSPCGHICCCFACGSSQSTCPYCRRQLSGKLNRITALADRSVPPLLEDGPERSIPDLQKENAQLQSQRLCIVCRQRDRAALFAPCGHIVACLPCSLIKPVCPCCNTAVQTKTTVYFS